MSDDLFELELTAMAHGGAALGRHERRVVFVPYTLPGERIQARLTEERKSFARGEVVEILSPSPHRVEPPCPHFGPGRCGGCHWQHIDYEAQLEFKQTVVRDQLQRIGKFDSPQVRPTLPSPSPWGYRAYMTFTVDEAGRLGLWSDDNARIVPIEECHILDPALLDAFQQLDLDPEGIERVRFQVGSQPDDRMVILSTTDDLAPEIEVDFPVSVNLLLSDNEPVNLIGSPQVSYQVFDRAFQVTAGGFFQSNPPVAEMLVEQVLTRLDLAFIAPRAGLVVSVESYPPAVTDADANLADLDNVDLVEGSVEAVLDDLAGPIDAAVVDPPRTGLSRAVIEGLIRLAPATLVYVSCDPATLARDARQLAEGGFELLDVQPVDMFPQTYHVECVASLRHR
ncbi:MAG: class I SAM-dependent RNA methyltransferase [Chloroflexota bacterium]